MVFLYFQLRQVNAQVLQTERNQRALMNQGVINRGVEIARWFAEPHMVGLVPRVFAGETQFSLEELASLNLALRVSLTNAQDAFVQHKAGLADDISFDYAMRPARNVLSQPVHRALWKRSRAIYAPAWVTFIDRLIEATPLATPRDAVADFQADLAEVLG